MYYLKNMTTNLHISDFTRTSIENYLVSVHIIAHLLPNRSLLLIITSHCLNNELLAEYMKVIKY